jgi:hypothetical protein
MGKNQNTRSHRKKKSLKIPKGQSETVYRRRADNTMAKRKSTKGQTTQVLRKGKQFLLH